LVLLCLAPCNQHQALKGHPCGSRCQNFLPKFFRLETFCCMDTPLLFICSLSRDTWVLPPFGFCAEPLVCPDLLNWQKGCPDPHLPSLSSSKGSCRAVRTSTVHNTMLAPHEGQSALLEGAATGRGAGGAAGPPLGKSWGLTAGSGQSRAGEPLAGLGRLFKNTGVLVIRYILQFMGCGYLA